MATTDADSARVLVLAPVGRDCPASAELLRRVGLASHLCADLAELVECLEARAGAVFIAEEALFGKVIEDLVAWVEHQPPWSDLPFVIADQPPGAARGGDLAGTVGQVAEERLASRAAHSGDHFDQRSSGGSTSTATAVRGARVFG